MRNDLRVDVSTLQLPNEVKALLLALQIEDADTSHLKNLSENEWKCLLAFCSTAHLTLVLAQLPMDGFPEWVAKELHTNLADNTLRFGCIQNTYREVAEALHHVGVEHIVIKGFTQAPYYVADPRFRSQSDIDIVCAPDKVHTAQRALEALGYKAAEKVDGSCADHVPALVRPGKWQWRGNHFDPEMPLGIELHFCLWNQFVSRISIPEVELFWKRRTTRISEGLAFPCLSHVDHLGHLSLHILRNIFLHDWVIHHVRELAFFLHAHASDDVFWQNWTEIHSSRLRSFEAIAFYHAAVWFNCQLHPLVEREIANLPAMQQDWLHHFSHAALDVMFRQNKDSLWLHLSLLSSRNDQWAIFKETIIPPRIGSLDSSVVRVRNKRALPSKEVHPWRQYLAYLASRSAAHGRADMVTLFRGLRWRIAQMAH